MLHLATWHSFGRRVSGPERYLKHASCPTSQLPQLFYKNVMLSRTNHNDSKINITTYLDITKNYRTVAMNFIRQP